MHEHRIPATPHPDDLKRVKDDFRALADETRLQLLLLLSRGERSVGELVEELGTPQSTVSRHLGILRATELVRTRRDGPRVLYRLATSHVRDLLQQAFSHAEHERLGLADHDDVPGSIARAPNEDAGEATG